MAIRDYDTTIRLKPSKTVLTFSYVKRGNAKLDNGDNIGAIEDSRTAIHLDPDLAEAYGTRDDAKSNLGNYAEAV